MQNESFLVTFIEESGDNLASVENDLVEMERAAPEIDQELVNRVFRAAHSIKGGAGFFELATIKELSHRLENVLELIRSRSLAPNPEVVNILLGGFDRLKSLLDDVERANEADISDEVVALAGLASSYLPPARKAEAVEMRRFPIPGSARVLEAGALQIDAARDEGRGIAMLRFDLIHDVQRLGRTPLEVLGALEANGSVLDSVVDIAAVGDLDSDTIASDLPFYVLFSTQLSVVGISRIIEIPTSGITIMELPRTVAPPGAAVPGAAVPGAAVPGAAIPAPIGAGPETTAEEKEETGRRDSSAAHRDEGEGTIRIQVAVLDKLMNIAGELVLARNELLEAIDGGERRSVLASGRRIDVVTREMQEAVMLTRMQPIGNLFNRYPRIVRDMTRATGKKIELSISGREVEVDKTILETLSDPLTHLVRNACDHGIEEPGVREAAGKSVTGTVSLRARHEAGTVVVEIRDDGAGIDVEAVSAKAMSLGLVTAERLKFMSDKEKAALILLPGLSTARKITDISGRGVGMDVVKTNIDKIGGQIEILTERGRGSGFRIKLPLTLAIIPSLLVSVSGERYAIPETNVEELLKVRAGDAKNRIERVGDRSVLVLRGTFIPLVRLADALGVPRVVEDPESGEPKPDRRANLADRRGGKQAGTDGADAAQTRLPARSDEERRYHAASDYSVVVVNSAALRYALVVDELHDTMEIVVKPLGGHFSKLREYSGATILGNGSTALILDTTGLAARAGLVSGEGRETGTEQAGGEEAAAETSAAGASAESLGLLLFGNGERERCAMRLESVDRVMKIARSDIDTIGSSRMITHDGRTVPVFALGDALEVSDIMAGSGELALILARAADRYLGILATPPVDSLSTEAEIDTSSFAGRGLQGSAIIRGRTTLVVDVEDFARVVKPEWFSAGPTARSPEERASGSPGPKAGALVLVADDSNFFRSRVKEILAGAGYGVLEAGDGAEALALFGERASALSAVVADIEMPEMDGFELSRRIRASGSGLPIIALTSLASDEDRRKATEAGVDVFQVKLDEGELLKALGELIRNSGAARDRRK